MHIRCCLCKTQFSCKVLHLSARKQSIFKGPYCVELLIQLSPKCQRGCSHLPWVGKLEACALWHSTKIVYMIIIPKQVTHQGEIFKYLIVQAKMTVVKFISIPYIFLSLLCTKYTQIPIFKTLYSAWGHYYNIGRSLRLKYVQIFVLLNLFVN